MISTVITPSFSTPVISVVVPAFNLAGFIGACLASVVAQSFPGWECIVVDDGSTDGSDRIVAAQPDGRIGLLRQPNRGVSSARNAGLGAASGRYVMFLDGDDLLHPTALARLLAALERSPASVAAFGTFRKILENGAPYPQQKSLDRQRYPAGDVLEPMLKENFLANGGHVLARIEAAREIGGFNEALRLSEDWEFWCRLASRGPFQYIAPQPEVFYLRVRGGSSSGGLASDWDNHRQSIKAVLANPDLAARFSRAAWRKLKRQVLASHMWEAGRVNFVHRRFKAARRLMLGSLMRHPRPKRLALFAIAQVSAGLNVSLASRLRFHDHDQRAAAGRASDRSAAAAGWRLPGRRARS